MKSQKRSQVPNQWARILVPCDFSQCSRIALDSAITLAKPLQATLVLLHVIEPVQPGFLMEGETRQHQGRRRDRAEHELRQWTRPGEAEVLFSRPLVKAGKPWEVIVHAAQTGGIDLIVMGTHGHTGLKHAVLGSVAERVVRHAPCPVLTVRTPRRMKT